MLCVVALDMKFWIWDAMHHCSTTIASACGYTNVCVGVGVYVVRRFHHGARFLIFLIC